MTRDALSEDRRSSVVAFSDGPGSSLWDSWVIWSWSTLMRGRYASLWCLWGEKGLRSRNWRCQSESWASRSARSSLFRYVLSWRTCSFISDYWQAWKMITLRVIHRDEVDRSAQRRKSAWKSKLKRPKDISYVMSRQSLFDTRRNARTLCTIDVE